MSFLTLPPGLITLPAETGHGFMITVPLSHAHEGQMDGFALPALDRYLAWANPGLYWNDPQHGDAHTPFLPDTQAILWRDRNGRCGLLLALVAAGFRSVLSGSPQDLRLSWEDGKSPATPSPTAGLLYAAEGDDPYRLLEAGFASLAQILGTLRLRHQKPRPGICERLGWCTWDSFYQSVNEDLVEQGWRSFRAAGIPLGWTILDDGWMDYTRRDYLVSFRADQAKFPHGLKSLIRKGKTEYGLTAFGVWHALQGYWGGLAPEGELAQRFSLLANRAILRPWEPGPPEMDTFLVAPEDAAEFFDEWHTELQKAGVDFVKVDGQASTHLFTRGKVSRGVAMRCLQQAVQSSVARHFGNQMIHCMCHGNDIMLHLGGGSLWRNSTDYFPTRSQSAFRPTGADDSPAEPVQRPKSVHQRHLYQNTYNALLHSQLAWPDWDMFQSDQPDAAFHACARAIAGGPVYVSDHPGQHDAGLLRGLIDATGQILGCPEPALPSPSILWCEVTREPRLLKLENHVCDIGILGLFHCLLAAEGQPAPTIQDTVSTDDFRTLSTAREYAVYRRKTGRAVKVGAGEKIPLTLAEMEADLLFFSPLVRGLAPLGALDKFCAPAAFLHYGWITPTMLACQCRPVTEIVFFAETPPSGTKEKRGISSGRKPISFFASGFLHWKRPSAWHCVRSEI